MSTLHPEVLRILRESGLMRLVVPAAYGGRDETVDPVAVCIVRESLMSVCSAADSLFALQGIGSFAITVAGSSDQRENWLTPRGKRRDTRRSRAYRAGCRFRP